MVIGLGNGLGLLILVGLGLTVDRWLGVLRGICCVAGIRGGWVGLDGGSHRFRVRKPMSNINVSAINHAP